VRGQDREREEEKKQCHLNTFDGQPVGISGAIALQQAVALEFAQIVAELVEPIGVGRKLKGGEDGLVDLFGSPAADRIAAMEQNLE